MSGVPDGFTDDERLFEGDRERRFLAVALETAVQDLSPAGDDDVARQLGAYAVGEADPPAGAPEYVELSGDDLELSNPPFLLAEATLSGNDGYVVELAFDSELELLIDPPVEVAVEGPLTEVVDTLEQLLAEIYRTRGRRLEMLDSGTVSIEEIADRR